MRRPPSFGLPKWLAGLLLALGAALVLIGINEAGHSRSAQALDGMAREFQTRSALNRLLLLVVDAETGSRGFLLTGDARYLEPYDRAVAEIGQNLEALRATYAAGAQETHDAADAELLAQLQRNVQRKLSEMDLSVRMRKQGNEDAWKFVLLTDVGKEHMDAIRGHVATLSTGIARRIDAAERDVRRTLLLSRAGIAVATLVALGAFWLYLRQTSALEAAGEAQQRALQQERDQLEVQVRERTASLAQLATHLQQVREDERGHLARELHDELGALLTAAKLDVARLKSRLGAQPPETAQRLQHLTETLNSGIALKRRIIEDLRPSSLANLGLTAALEILAREFSERSGIEVATTLDAVEMDDGLQLTVYRLVQESLTNMAKYAHARQAQVTVRQQGGDVEVAVRDDGRGFDPGHARPSSHGLAGMRHRVEAAGGRLSIESAPGHGTRVAAVLPTRAAA